MKKRIGKMVDAFFEADGGAIIALIIGLVPFIAMIAFAGHSSAVKRDACIENNKTSVVKQECEKKGSGYVYIPPPPSIYTY